MLITGEPGTGKSLLAKLIHDWSDRAEKSFISVNAGGLPESVFESEMFGHVKGAFTDAKADRAGRFELADGGTLFLDEIGNVPPAQQARLCARSRPASSSASAPRARSAPTCAWCRRRTRTCR